MRDTQTGSVYCSKSPALVAKIEGHEKEAYLGTVIFIGKNDWGNLVLVIAQKVQGNLCIKKLQLSKADYKIQKWRCVGATELQQVVKGGKFTHTRGS